MHNESDRIPLLIALLDDIDFRDNNWTKDEQKLILLKDEIVNSFRRTNCVSQICNSFESGKRQDLYKQGNKTLENFASNICSVLSFSAAECVALAYCLTHSQYHVFVSDAMRILSSKCSEINSIESVANIHGDLLTAIGNYIYHSEELSAVSNNFLHIVKARAAFAQQQSNNNSNNSGNMQGLRGLHSLNDNLSQQKVSIAQILGDIGSSCAANMEVFRNTLQKIGQKLDEEQLAGIIVTTLARAMVENEEKRKLMDTQQTYVPWNLEVVADTLLQECRGLNWPLVAKHLDHPSLIIRSESDYQLLTRFFVRISGSAVPAAGLLAGGTLWNNRSAQFAMLTLAASSPRNIVDFSSLVTADHLITGEGIATPPNYSWLCLPLYTRFFELASAGMHNEVMEVLTKAASNYPEYFLISLSQVQDNTNSAIRSDLLRRLLPLFTGLQGSSRPTYLSVMRKLHSANPDMLILLCRIAFKKAKKVWEVANIDSLLTSLGSPIIRRLEEEASTDELMSYYCLKADRSELNLEEKAVLLLENNSKNARVFVSFAKTHADTLRPRSSGGGSGDGILSFECFAVLLRAVQGYPSIVPIEEVRALATLFAQHQQSLQLQQQQQQQQHLLAMQGQQQQQQLASVGRELLSDNNTGDGMNSMELPSLPPGPESEEIEALANSYFQKIYTTDFSINDVISLLRQFKGSSEKKEQEIFRCMIYNLFDEFRFFHKYPEKELQITGRLYGALIQHQLVSSITLGIALRYVLEALRKDPELGESNDKMFRFGRIALDQFRVRLGEWPQYCSHLIQIPHLGRHCPDLFQDAQRALATPQLPTQMQPPPPPTMTLASQQQQQMLSQQQHLMSGSSGSYGGSEQMQQQHLSHLASQQQQQQQGYGIPQHQLQQQSTSSIPESAGTGSSGNLLGGSSNSGMLGIAQQLGSMSLSGSSAVVGGSAANLGSIGGNVAAAGSDFSSANNAFSSTGLGSTGGNSSYNLLGGAAAASSTVGTMSMFPTGGAGHANSALLVSPLLGGMAQPIVANISNSSSGNINAAAGAPILSITASPPPNQVPPSPLVAPLPAPAVSAAASSTTTTIQEEAETKSETSFASFSSTGALAAGVNITDSPVSNSITGGDGNISEGTTTSNRERSGISEIARMAIVNADVLNTVMPPESVRDQIHFIINNIAKNNFDVKTNEIREVLKPDHFNWFANYLVVKRISTQPNLHPLYLNVLDTLDLNVLIKLVLDSAYHNVTKLLQSPNITTSSSERSLLRNLGVWLGQMTLAKNRPLLQRRINLKELLFWGFETGRLIAVCSFVAKIVEGVKDSKVFRPPNPWLMAILGIMRELYEIEDLKLNIKFEVQVLCKNINIKIEDIPRGNELSRCKMPIKDQRNPDFNFKPSAASGAAVMASPVVTNNQPSPPAGSVSAMLQRSPAPSMLDTTKAADANTNAAPSQQLQQAAAASSAAAAEMALQQILANLASNIVISTSLQYFVNNPNQRRLVAVAVERGIKEIIQSAVDRSVTIAATTTKHILLKDFATEPNEENLRDGAHLMVSSLSGSLALATCKEPLRIAIGNHLRTLLAQAISDQTVIEQIVQVCSNDNVDLGATLIEKASIEKSVREIDDSIAAAMLSRRKAREANQLFIDPAFLSQPGNKYLNDLPEALRPRVGGLNSPQFRVYEAFQQRPRQLPGTTLNTASPSTGALPNASAADGEAAMKALPPVSAGSVLPAPAVVPAGQQPYSMAQALEAYQIIFSRIDQALRALQVQLGGREVSISMLGNENEIVLLLRDLITITQRTQPNVRNETAMTFSENIFNRMFESISNPDPLRLEVLVAILEAIRDACGGSKVFSPDFISWLGKYSMLVSNDDTARKVYRLILILLLRAKLLLCPDVDVYFVMYIEGGQNLFWLELALSFIRQCLVEGMGSIYDFGGTFEAVTKMRPTNAVVKKQLQKWLTDIKALATAQEEQKASNAAAAPAATSAATQAAAAASARDAAVKEHVALLLDRWLRVWNSVNDQQFGGYLQLMHQYGVLKTEDAADRFFRLAIEICVEACLRNPPVPAVPTPPVAAGSEPPAAVLNYSFIDALSKLFLLLARFADKESSDMNARVNLLSRVLNAAARTVLDDHEAKKTSKIPFDQRPYYRLFSNMSHDLGVPDHKAAGQEPNPAVFPMLAAYTQVYLALQPSTVPGFAYAWIQLISRRSYMPHLLLAKSQKGWPYMHRLLSALLLFLQPFLKSAQLNDSVRKLYKGTLRVLLILLHDFPEFLSDFHLSVCDLIPVNCVQLRNLVLSAFPRSMRLPDPFTANLKVDVLVEITQHPRILTDYAATLSGIRTHLDNYMATKQPAELPVKLPAVLTSGTTPTGTYNLPLITSIVVYVGHVAIAQMQTTKIPLTSSPAMDIFKAMALALDAEGRYILFNTMANQLRYPNSHTNFFSNVLLQLFLEAENEYLQEQITRVLLERLIVHRPHPWGLLITFIELIKNPRYFFWCKSFIQSAPEMSRVFESIARSCIGPAAAAIIQQQQQMGNQASAATSTTTPSV